MTIALDAMGGDFPVAAPVKAAAEAVVKYGLDIVLLGDEPSIRQELQRHDIHLDKIRIHHCTQTVEMDEAPAHALRQKKDSSIRVALNLLKENQVQAVVSAGNTGAVMAMSKFVLNSIPGIDRPAIIAIMPSVKGQFVILDVGANVDCKPQYLLQFAIMGSAYSRSIMGCNNPRVALLNNGEEEGKGNILLKEAYGLLKKSTLNFVGNTEGKTMFKSDVDVIVCDGFVGNITLKVAEGTFEYIQYFLKKEIKESFWAKLSFLGMKGAFKNLKKTADYTEIGGAPLLGVRGNVTICHGSSKPHTLVNALKQTHVCIKHNLYDRICTEIIQNQELLAEASKITLET